MKIIIGDRDIGTDKTFLPDDHGMRGANAGTAYTGMISDPDTTAGTQGGKYNRMIHPERIAGRRRA
jgi:hypothetical protein